MKTKYNTSKDKNNTKTISEQLAVRNINLKGINSFINSIEPRDFYSISFDNTFKQQDVIDRFISKSCLVKKLDKGDSVTVPVEFSKDKFFLIKISYNKGVYNLDFYDSYPNYSDSRNSILEVKNMILFRLKQNELVKHLEAEENKGARNFNLHAVIGKIKSCNSFYEFNELFKNIKNTIKNTADSSCVNEFIVDGILSRFKFLSNVTYKDCFKHLYDKDSGLFTLFNWFLLNKGIDNLPKKEIDISNFKKVVYDRVVDISNGIKHADIISPVNAILADNKINLYINNPLLDRVYINLYRASHHTVSFVKSVSSRFSNKVIGVFGFFKTTVSSLINKLDIREKVSDYFTDYNKIRSNNQAKISRMKLDHLFVDKAVKQEKIDKTKQKNNSYKKRFCFF